MTVDPLREGAIPDTLEVVTSRDSDRWVIALSGELDLAGVGGLADAVAQATSTDVRMIVLDLHRLEFLDSTGIHAILKAERLATAKNMGFVIIRGPRQVERIFEIAGLADRLVFADP